MGRREWEREFVKSDEESSWLPRSCAHKKSFLGIHAQVLLGLGQLCTQV